MISEHNMYSGQRKVSDCDVCHYDKETLSLFYNVILPYKIFFTDMRLFHTYLPSLMFKYNSTVYKPCNTSFHLLI